MCTTYLEHLHSLFPSFQIPKFLKYIILPTLPNCFDYSNSLNSVNSALMGIGIGSSTLHRQLNSGHQTKDM